MPVDLLDLKLSQDEGGEGDEDEDERVAAKTRRALNVDIPEVDISDKVIQQMRWNDRARENQGQFLTLQEVQDIIEEGVKLDLPEHNEYLSYYKDQRHWSMA